MSYAIRKLQLESGERFVNLVNSEGVPLFLPTIWSITSLRGRGRAFNTIHQAVKAVELLYVYLLRKGIDLDQRLKAGNLLNSSELEGLLEILKKPADDIRGNVNDMGLGAFKHSKKIESRRRLSPPLEKEILPNTALIRIIYVREFLEYCCTYTSYGAPNNKKLADDLSAAKELLIRYLKGRAPKHQKSLDERLGLSSETQSKINELIKIDSPQNPWINKLVRQRNFLMIRFLMETGMRRGEMLGVMVPDINFRTHTVKVVRRPDNPQDPRKNQPVVKTLSREIPISEKLCMGIRDYISFNRNKHLKARKHGYLFTATTNGEPLSITGLNRVFKVINEALPEDEKSISAHIIRHTWNDNFSKYCDKNQLDHSDEERSRKEIMGWTQSSLMAARYSRRHTKEAANKILEDMQKNHWSNARNE